MVVHWTDEADVKLFIAVLKIHNVKLNYEALAAAMGPDVTAKAITQHITKLRAKAAAASEEGDAPTPTKTTAKSGPAAPKKRARGVVGRRVKKTTGTGVGVGVGKKQKQKGGTSKDCGMGGGDGEDDDEELGDGLGEGDGEGDGGLKMDDGDGVGFRDDGEESGPVKVEGENGGE